MSSILDLYNTHHIYKTNSTGWSFIGDALRELVLFVQFKKRESQKQHSSMGTLIFFKFYKWYQITQSISYLHYYNKRWPWSFKRYHTKWSNTIKKFVDKLFKCVWPFCRVGAYMVKSGQLIWVIDSFLKD